MSQHVFAWIAGFGWTLMPFTPFRFERLAGRPRAVVVQHTAGAEARRVTVEMLSDGRAVLSEPPNGPRPRGDVVELIEGAAFPHWEHAAAHDHWRIETSMLSVRWPAGFAVRSVADAPPPFELEGPDHALIWVQGPFRKQIVPPPEQMIGEGQTLDGIRATEGGAMVELSYVHDGTPWNMFHCIVDRYSDADCVVTGQTPTNGRELVRAAVEEVAASLTPCQPE